MQLWSLKFSKTNMFFFETEFYINSTPRPVKTSSDAFESREDIYTLYLDFSKAFHRVCHQILLKNYEHSALVVTCKSC